ncbi:hypothetical protein AB0F43_06275 [Kribbella sp. NPDC023972]|uniref:hypothetical protein n=1 Tax=Kribbella sp. NPDC023972 TaxID=3154795 RepID=UPI0033D5EC21
MAVPTQAGAWDGPAGNTYDVDDIAVVDELESWWDVGTLVFCVIGCGLGLR